MVSFKSAAMFAVFAFHRLSIYDRYILLQLG